MLDYINDLFGGFAETKNIKDDSVVNIANTLEADYANIRNDVGIFPMSFNTYLKINIDDVEETLDYLLTKSIQFLNYGQNKMCYFLNDSGEVEAMITIYKNDDNFIIEVFNWDVSTVANILLEKDISFEKLDFSCILLEGVSTIDFLAEELELSVDYFVYQTHQESECCGEDILVARTGYTGEYGYKLIGDTKSIKKIWASILPAHKDKMTGYTALEMCQYEIKQPFWELPYLSLTTNAFEIDYHWFVDFKKDIDYRGKDALFAKATEAAKQLVGALSDEAINIGSDVELEGFRVGKVADSRFSIGLQKYINMLFVDKKYAHSDVLLRTTEDAELTIVSAPYLFPASWSVNR